MMRPLHSFIIPCLTILVAGGISGCATRAPRPLDLALSEARENRAELEHVISHYRSIGDVRKSDAARFLIENMPGHGYVVTALFDQDNNEIAFDPLEYNSFSEAQHRLDQLEQEHGPIRFRRKRFDADLHTITTAFLMENIDLAFEAWETLPWAKNLSRETFYHFVLPYRGTNEPLDSWRSACMARYVGLADSLENPTDPRVAAQLIREDVASWVQFSDLYYLHPTDQGFEEMVQSQKGRCEDITNMMTYALRANAIPVASDYTPFWADRDNNHAWEVVLDAQGRGHAPLSNKAAKVYRKMFATQSNTPGALRREGESVPQWLSSRNYIDVTEQYIPVSDVHIVLQADHVQRERFVYLCVFNGGKWQAIHWAYAQPEQTIFTRMGRGILYLPACYINDEIIPVADPFILMENEEIHTLDGNQDTFTLLIQAPSEEETVVNSDTPTVFVSPGKEHELFVWQNNDWQSLGVYKVDTEPILYEDIPAGRLYWLVETTGRRLERPFSIKGNQVTHW